MDNDATARFDPVLDTLEWVVWSIEVRDPRQLTASGIGDRTLVAMSELSAAYGCVFEDCCDDDSYDGTPENTYYRWDIRVPRGQHLDRDAAGVPRAIKGIGDWLRTQLPSALDDWIYKLDINDSLQVAAAEELRAEAAELLVPLEVALLGLRCDGAQELEPLLRCYASGEGFLAGTYSLLLCRDPDGHGETKPWLVLYAGIIPPAEFWTTPEGTQLARFAHTDHPILMAPLPAGSAWWISVATAPFVSTIPSPTSAFAPVMPTVVAGARHQWTGSDSAALVERATADLVALFPRLRDGVIGG